MKNNQGGSYREYDSPTVFITVFGDPVSKARARTVTNTDRYGRRHTHSYTPQKTADQEERIALVYKSLYHGFRFEPDVPLIFVANLYLKIPSSTSNKKREAMLSGYIRPTVKNLDADNGLKLAMDALLKVAYDDDSQIVEATVRKYYSDRPRTEIFIARVERETMLDVRT